MEIKDEIDIEKICVLTSLERLRRKTHETKVWPEVEAGNEPGAGTDTVTGIEIEADIKTVTSFEVKFDNIKEMEEKVGCVKDPNFECEECHRCKFTAETMEEF